MAITLVVSIPTFMILNLISMYWQSFSIPLSCTPYLSILLVALTITQLSTRSHYVATFRKQPGKSKKRTPKLRLPNSLHQPFIFLLVLFVSMLSTKITPLIHLIAPLPLPTDHTILAQERGPTGLISVVQVTNKYLLLAADMSILGGYHTKEGYEQDSIFMQFYLHEAIRFTQLPNEDLVEGGRNGRTLCIGVGVGVVAHAMHLHGCKVDAVELDGVVAKYAKKWFGLGANVIVGDGVEYVKNSPGEVYDYVIHDVFTGGSTPVSLVSVEMFQRIARTMKRDGVLSINVVGDANNSPSGMAVATVYYRLKHVFGFVRAFSDDMRGSTHNIVLFASKIPERMKFRKATEKDTFNGGGRESIYEQFEKLEVTDAYEDMNMRKADWEIDWALNKGLWQVGMEHETIMRQAHGNKLWPALLAAERRRKGSA